MSRKSIAAVCFGAGIALVDIAVAEPGIKEPTIVLFGASWCAPCRVELRNLPSLARAAAPFRIEIAWIDRAPAAGTLATGSNITILSPEGARQKLEMVAGSNQGLPIVAMIDGNGHPCAVLRQPATVARIQSLVARCPG